MYEDQIRIIFEDRDVLVCYKPAGIAVQSAGLTAVDMESVLRNRLKDREESGVSFLGVVHRLDQPVEGLLVFAGTPEADASLSRQVQGEGMGKEYLALVHPTEEGRALLDGLQGGEERKLTDWLVRDGKTRMARITRTREKDAKRAELYFSVEEEREDLALLRVRLVTGRYHQIRAQLSNAGLPISGDRKYGAKQAGTPELKFPALCAYRLAFTYPKTGKRMKFELKRSEISFFQAAGW